MARDLKDYFNGLSDVLASRARMAGDSAENSDIGTNRELICRELLGKHLPARLTPNLGGDVFGVGGKRSGQIDILINHDMSMNFLENSRMRCAAESLTAAVSVKSVLDKSSLNNALENLASIPQCYESIINLGPIAKPVSEYLLSWPSLYLFAFDGVKLETCRAHVVDFYAQNAVPLNRIPRAIIVNRQYILLLIHYQISGATKETKFHESMLTPGLVPTGMEGYPLFWWMHELAKGVSWLHNMYLDYAPYYNEAYPPRTRS